MSRTANIRPTFGTTYEGASVTRKSSPEEELQRAVSCCFLWENEFYRDVQHTAQRIEDLVALVAPSYAAQVAIDARTKYKLRHAPLWVLAAMLEQYKYSHESDMSKLIAEVIQRPDEMTELLSLYWRKGKKPLSNQLKRGLAAAFGRFNEYQLAKFDKPGVIRIRDVMFLCHPKPADADREALYKRIANNAMVTPDTWEVALSGGADQKETWIRLIAERKLGADALLKNLRNMQEAGVHADVIRTGLLNANVERILPFRFITAARYAKQFEPELEQLMFKCLEGNTLKGNTILLVDKSGSMAEKVSDKSELTRYDAACGLAMLLREECKNVRVFTFNYGLDEVAPRRGFALRDALGTPNGGTHLGAALEVINKFGADRNIVITDEQSQDQVGGPRGKGYMLNVASYEKTIGYDNWVRVAGWSEAIVDFIKQFESK